MERCSNEGPPESSMQAQSSVPHNRAVCSMDTNNYVDLTVDDCVPPSYISDQPSASESFSQTEANLSLSTSKNRNGTTTGQPDARTNLNLYLTKLTKEQREAIKAQKEKEKALLKAKRDAENLKREKEKAELKAKRDAENLKREKEKAELKAKRDAENQRKELEKREKQQKMEQEMKERREKKEVEELEKKERREKREAERKKRENEKKLKEEEKKKKLEEKEQLKEEKLRRENQAKMKFRSFFTEIKKPAVKVEFAASRTMLTPFSVKDGMTLAVPSRLPLQDTSTFDSLLEDQDSTAVNYLQSCRSRFGENNGTTRSETATLSMDIDAESCQAWDGIRKERMPMFKLLQFCENHRPAYYGSWTKQRGCINPRNPFKMDSCLLDYGMDSDEEWEEEEPGESVSNSEDEDKDTEQEEEEDDDGFFVPHGYLSNDEGDHSDTECGLIYPNIDPNDPQERKNSQLAKARAWEAEFARKCQLLNKKKIGPLWLHPQPINTSSPDGSMSCDEAFLLQFAAVSLVPLPIPYPMASKGESSVEVPSDHLYQGSGSTGESMKQLVPEEAMPDLIQFIHESSMGMMKIIKLFRTHWGAKVWGDTRETSSLDSKDSSVMSNGVTPHKTDNRNQTIDSTPKRNKTPIHLQGFEASSGISKRQLEMKIRAIAVKEVRSALGKPTWYVHVEILKQYGLDQGKIVALVSDSSSPTLIKADIPGMTKAVTPCMTKAVISPDTIAKQRKRKSYANTSKSLICFLKSASSPSPKRVKTEEVTTGQQQQQAKENEADDDVVFVKVASVVDDENLSKAPPAKKLHTIEPLAATHNVTIL